MWGNTIVDFDPNDFLGITKIHRKEIQMKDHDYDQEDTSAVFESFKSAVAYNTIRFYRNEMSKEDYFKSMVVILGKDTFDRVIEILDDKNE